MVSDLYNVLALAHEYQMDCWWNAAIENQGNGIVAQSASVADTHGSKAIDRVHRIGQERTVFVTHFIVGGAFLNDLFLFSPR